MSHTRETTAGDVVRFEQEELSNKLGVTAEMLHALDQFSATQIVWVTRNVEDAKKYATDVDVEFYVVEEFSEQARIIADDGEDGGFLIFDPKNHVHRSLMKEKKRIIELGVSLSNKGEDYGTWGTELVEIPLNTPEEDIEQTAKDIFLGGCLPEFKDSIVHIWLYWVPEIGELDEE